MTLTPMSCTQFTQAAWNTRHGMGHGYVALGVKDRNRDKEEDPTLPFWWPLLCEMIKDTDSSR